ncbi:YcfL family protein [Pantoea sp. 1.19]|uniref:YcfL family protein n=1 Tax=Pantoea sp. 1.19 TaxID=1925589 RepID=UPI000948ECC0|nr:DUF1425 domain-containing protein [Pantoea sp. 1.19]
MTRRLFPLMALALLTLTGCSGDTTAINTSQSLVMDAAVLSAGISTDEPTISEVDGQQRASSSLYNEQEKAVTLHYRFYWYDDKGLELLPFERARTVTVPPHQRVQVISQTGNLNASKVRLWLYL